ncbi:fibronectin type III domain-containing protein [Actinomadura sp. ATCC 31491]|uniref:Fibronectin type III domain-containing protein n=1 Tax=Actinomadura luzonensis TaxID=2805427 RepID=A0ABT0G0N1_9ACTN|nr:fibronectin type III domain-containing protein [Actinomadura luzonensis]MCK2218169.1 fibronectin type III domain-containing protein [Actinomadura luzonensis]
MRWLTALALIFSGVLVVTGATAASAASAQPGPGQFYGARVRVLTNASIAAGATTTLSVAGVGAVPASGVASVALNLAAKGASAAGGLIVFPSDLTAAPAVTGARYRSGVWDDQLVTVKLGADGALKVKNTGTAAVNVYADVHGYFTATAATTPGARYVPLNTARIIGNQSVAANSTATFAVAGLGGVPASGVAYVALTFAVKSTGSGKMIAYPSGGTLPVGSNIDYRPSYFQSNLVIAALGTDGKIAVNNNGAAALTVYADVAGYFATPAAAVAASALVPVAPSRTLASVTVAAGASYTVAPLGKGGVPAAGVSAVGVNITAKGTVNGLLRVYPAGQTGIPGGGSIAYQPNDFWSSLVPVKVGTGGTFVILNTGTASVSVTVDTFDYYRSPAVPAAPTGIGATAGDAAATVTWQRPADGGAPITGYTVTSSPGDRTATVSGDQLQATVTGLANGTAYTFTVTAANAVGTSARSASSAPVTPAGAPGRPSPPLGVSATPGDRSARITWRAPATDGGSTITRYAVTASPGGAVVTTAGTEATVTGLANGTAYTFTVTAANAVGVSDASAPSDPVTPGPPNRPGRPFITGVYGRDSAVRVTWAPPETGAADVTGYTVTASPGGAVVSTADTEATVTGLVNGTAYTFTVTATGAAGAGEPSPPSDAVRPQPAEVPMSPPALLVTPLDQRVDVQWAPAVDGGSAITGYTVSVQPGGLSMDIAPDTTVATVTGLANGTAYTVTVVARNAVGASAPSTAAAVTPSASRPPGAPTHLRAALPASGSVQVDWDAPADTGTAPVTGYTLTASPGGRTATVTATTATLAGLDPATAYTFTVRATSAAGTGAASAPTEAITPKLTVKTEPRVLSPQAALTLRAVRDGALEFEDPPAEVTGLTAGTLLVIGQSDRTPQGFFGKVSGLARQNGRVVVSTTPASLSDAFTDAGFATDGRVDSGDQVRFVPSAPGARLVRPVQSARDRAAGPRVGIRDGNLVVEFEEVFEHKGRSVTKVEGWAVVDQDTRMGASTDASGRGVDVSNTTKISSEVRVKQGFGFAFSKRMHLGHVNGPCRTFWLGRVPVVVCVRLSVALSLEASTSVGLSFAVHWDKQLGTRCHTSKTGTSCTPDDGGPGFYADGGVGVYGDGAVTTAISTDIQLLLYGLVGPALVVDVPGVQLKADTTQNPWWELRALARLGAAIDLGAIGKDYSVWRKDDIISTFWTIAHAGGAFQGIKVTPQVGGIGPGQNYQFKVTVTGYPDDVATQWKLLEGPGTLTADGLFNFPQEGLAVVEVTSPATGGHPQLQARGAVQVGANFGAPGPPTLNTWTAPTLRGATVSWSPPTDVGVGTISGYVVTATAEDGSQTARAYAYGGDATHQLVQGLTPGVRYSVTVIAQNAAGTGEPAAPLKLTPTDVIFFGPPSTLGADLARSTETQGRPDSTGQAGGATGAAASGDGRYVFFLTQERSNLMPDDLRVPSSTKPRILRKDTQGGGTQVVSLGPDGVTPVYGFVGGPLASRDGNVVAFVSLEWTGVLTPRAVMHDIAAGTSWTLEEYGYVQAISDDGHAVVYSKKLDVHSATSRWNLYRQVKGGTPQKLTACDSQTDGDCPTSAGEAALSGDGNRVTWSTYDVSIGKDRTWLYDAATGGTTEIFPGTDVGDPIISGDGQVVALRYTAHPAQTSCLMVARISGATPGAGNCLVQEDANGYGRAMFLGKNGTALAYEYTDDDSVRSLRSYTAGVTHLAGGAPGQSWPVTAFITDDDQRLIYTLQYEGGTSTADTVVAHEVPGVWWDFTTGAMAGGAPAPAAGRAPARDLRVRLPDEPVTLAGEAAQPPRQPARAARSSPR